VFVEFSNSLWSTFEIEHKLDLVLFVFKLKFFLVFFLGAFFVFSNYAHGQNTNKDFEGPQKQKDSKKVLVLPSLCSAQNSEDKATLDVLLATAFKNLDFDIVESKSVFNSFEHMGPSLALVKELYLDMQLDKALKFAEQIRQNHLNHYGNLLGETSLTEIELFLVQLYLDLEKEKKAMELAIEILDRNPELKLSPVDYSPTMQALWVKASDKHSRMQPHEFPKENMKKLGVLAKVDWVVSGIRKKAIDGIDWFIVVAISTNPKIKSSRHSIKLGLRTGWASDVYTELKKQYAPLKEKPAYVQVPLLPTNQSQSDEKKEKKRWYKKWWVWTIVGVVVIGGTVGGIVAYKNRDRETGISLAEQ